MCLTEDFFYPSSDGVGRIRARMWRPESNPEAVLQIAHGICEHLERYDDFAHFLTEQGFLVVANDHLGHGKTAQAPQGLGVISRHGGWSCMVDDIETLRAKMADENPGLPYFLLGHSMGSFLVRTYLIRFPGRLTGALISGTGQQAPVLVTTGIFLTGLIGAFRGRDYRSALVQNMAFGSYNRKFEPKRTTSDWLTRDTEIVDGYQKDVLCCFVPSVAFYGEMLRGVRFISSVRNTQAMDKSMPVLFFSGALDPVGEETRGLMRAVDTFRRTGCRDVTVKVYPEGRHEMLNETNRAEVYADVLNWLKSKLPAKAEV
ncbi:MAG: alpha/beta hydrolase [Clostridiaceae bacterium]|nr:alpha/beta hydrolase [Clostridiaceae bacterium]